MANIFYNAISQEQIDNLKIYFVQGLSELSLEKYLINLPDDLRICMSKFRMCNHKFPHRAG